MESSTLVTESQSLKTRKLTRHQYVKEHLAEIRKDCRPCSAPTGPPKFLNEFVRGMRPKK